MLDTHALRAERKALDRAKRWIQTDPFYLDKNLTPREQALMRLAVRCLTFPGRTEAELQRRERELEAANTEEFQDWWKEPRPGTGRRRKA